MVALLLSGSAILLISCKAASPVEAIDEENVISKRVDSMVVIATDNGRKTQRFFSPLMEDYEFAKEPFQEHRYGIELITYDSLGLESSRIISDYALNWTKRELWELKGNVVASGSEGRTLYSQQLFWNRKTKKIYSNVDSKLEQNDEIWWVEGFEADDDFKSWTARKTKGKGYIDTDSDDEARESRGSVDEIGSSDNAAAAEAPPVKNTSADASEIVTDKPVRPVRSVERDLPAVIQKENFQLSE